MDKTSVALIGAGKVGSSLALALARAGHPVTVVVDHDMGKALEVSRAVGAGEVAEGPVAHLGRTGVVLISVPDGEIRPLAEGLAASGFLKEGQALCHTSGFAPSSDMAAAGPAGCGLASMHPMMSFAAPFTPLSARTPICYGLEGNAEGLRMASQLVDSLGGIPVRVPAEGKAGYHAACVMASGMVAALLGLAQKVFDAQGLSDDSLGMVRSLASSVVENLAHGDVPGSLTGPLARGQSEVVAEHLRALEGGDGNARAAYRALGLAMLGMAGEGIDQGARGRIEKLLKAD